MEKITSITLKEDEREYLASIVRSGTSPPISIQRAKILLLMDKGVPIAVISKTAGISKERVTYCLAKYSKGGAKYALYDARKQSKNNNVSNEEKAWIINIASQNSKNTKIISEFYNYLQLTKYINENAEKAGYPRLSTISYAKVIYILKQAGIESRYLRYPRRFISH